MEKIGRFGGAEPNPMNAFASFGHFLHQCLELLLYVCDFRLIFFLRFFP